jgi:GTP-binding protein
MNFNNVEFLISAAAPKDFPKNRLPEIAFAGKSNVGKSSVINRLLNRKNFARVGDKPGKTIHVNYFVIDKTCYFVDLPGYGYAKVSQSEKDRWGKLMEDYFASNRITLGVMIVDARHAPTGNDITMARWFIDSGCPFVVVANKLDKLKKSEIDSNLERIRLDLELPTECRVIPFSAEKGTGKEELVHCVLAAIQE